MNIVPDCLLTNTIEWKEVRRAKLGVRLDVEESSVTNATQPNVIVRLLDEEATLWKAVIRADEYTDEKRRGQVISALLGKSPEARAYFRFSKSKDKHSGVRVLLNGEEWITEYPAIRLVQVRSEAELSPCSTVSNPSTALVTRSLDSDRTSKKESGRFALLKLLLEEVKASVRQKEVRLEEIEAKIISAENEADRRKRYRGELQQAYEEECEAMIRTAILKLNLKKRRLG